MKHFYTDVNGATHTWETPDTHSALDTAGVQATLNVVLGLWPIEDAANTVGLRPEDLVAEAQSWALGALNAD